MEDNNANNSHEESLDAKKIKLEIEKLEIENRELNRKWFQKVSVYATLLPTIVTIILLFIGYKQDYIKLKLESLKQKEETLIKVENKLKTKEDSLSNKQEFISNTEFKLIQYKDSLDSIDISLNAKSLSLDKKSIALSEFALELDIEESKLEKRLLILEEEENIANIRFNIKQIISKDGYLSYDEERNLESFVNSKDEKVASLAFKVITEIIEADSITATVKGTLLKVLCDATYDKKWYNEIVTLYKEEYRNIPHRFFDLFENVNVTDGKSKYIDKSVNYEIVRLMLESLDYQDFRIWNKQDVFQVISSIIYRGTYNKQDFTDNFSSQFLSKLEKETCVFFKDIISNPQNHRDTTRRVFYGKSGFPYSVDDCTDILYTINSQYLSASVYYLRVNSNFRTEEFLLFEKDIKYLNSHLKENSKFCKIFALPEILDDESKWLEWGNDNNCIIDKFRSFATSR